MLRTLVFLEPGQGVIYRFHHSFFREIDHFLVPTGRVLRNQLLSERPLEPGVPNCQLSTDFMKKRVYGMPGKF